MSAFRRSRDLVEAELRSFNERFTPYEPISSVQPKRDIKDWEFKDSILIALWIHPRPSQLIVRLPHNPT